MTADGRDADARTLRARDAGLLATCALLAGCTWNTDFRERVVAARADLEPAAVVARGAAPEGDVVWVGRRVGPVPAMPWYDEFEWIPGPWHELRQTGRPDWVTLLPLAIATPLDSKPSGQRFLLVRVRTYLEAGTLDPRPGLKPGEYFACVGPVSVRDGRAILSFSWNGDIVPVQLGERAPRVRVIDPNEDPIR